MKKRWRVSAAAIVRRAFDLKMIDAADYQRAYKFMSAQGCAKALASCQRRSLKWKVRRCFLGRSLCWPAGLGFLSAT